MRHASPAHELEINVTRRGEVAVLEVEGEIDLATTAQLSAAISLAAASGPDTTVALDMSRVGLIDSTGLRAVLDASRRLDGGFVVLRPSREVRRILELTLLDATIPVADRLEDLAER